MSALKEQPDDRPNGATPYPPRDPKKKRRLRPYDIRQYFVTKALEEGADLKALPEIIGSRPETIMQHYFHQRSKANPSVPEG